jgi:hypothetical protein
VAAASLVYAAGGPVTGPVLSGCSVPTAAQVAVKFNTSLLAGGAVVVGEYNATAGLSGAAVLINASMYCMETLLRCPFNATTGGRPAKCEPQHHLEWYCGDDTAGAAERAVHRMLWDSIDRLGWRPPKNPYSSAWYSVPVAVGAAAGEIVLDVSSMNGTAIQGVRYGWETQCCNDGSAAIGKSIPCATEACPVKLSPSMLPPVPFMARIVGGKCSCAAPQVCDA